MSVKTPDGSFREQFLPSDSHCGLGEPRLATVEKQEFHLDINSLGHNVSALK